MEWSCEARYFGGGVIARLAEWGRTPLKWPSNIRSIKVNKNITHMTKINQKSKQISPCATFHSLSRNGWIYSQETPLFRYTPFMITICGITILPALSHLDRSEAKWRDPAQRLPQESKKISPLQILPDSPVEMTSLGDNHSLSPLSFRP